MKRLIPFLMLDCGPLPSLPAPTSPSAPQVGELIRDPPLLKQNLQPRKPFQGAAPPPRPRKAKSVLFSLPSQAIFRPAWKAAWLSLGSLPL